MNYIEAEEWVIAGLLNVPKNIERVSGKISPGDFSDPILSRTLDILKRTYEEKVPMEWSVIFSFLKAGLSVDGLQAVMNLKEEILCDESLEYWARVVKKGSLERELRECTGEDVDIEKAQAIIRELENLNSDETLYYSIKDVPLLSKEGTIKTGFRDLDGNLKLDPGDVVVIAGKTGEGKTSLGMGILYNISSSVPIGMISLEMTRGEIRMRLENSFSEKGIPDNFFVSDPYSLSIQNLRTTVGAMKKEQDVKVVLIDYLQLMREQENFQTRHLEVSHIIRRIKETAKELKITIFVISQLSRGIDSRGDGAIPSLSDLKESGDIEYAADVVIFIHSPEKENEFLKQLIIAKNRWGDTGDIKVLWDGSRTRFSDYKRSQD